MTLHSTCLADGRRLTVYVPRGFRKRPRHPYPLLLLHDGQNLFDGDRAHVRGQHWRVGETADRLIARGIIPPIVIAGLDHGGARRLREFTPTPGPRREGGGAGRYLRLIRREVLPDLFDRYPLSHEQADLVLGGSSLGGLVTLVAAAAHAGVFGGLLVMSPSVWWDRRRILSQLARRPGALRGTRVWLDIGAHEGPGAVADARRLRDLLRRLNEANEGEGPFVSYVEDPAGQHGERSWARRLPRALAFLFGGTRRASLRVARSPAGVFSVSPPGRQAPASELVRSRRPRRAR